MWVGIRLPGTSSHPNGEEGVLQPRGRGRKPMSGGPLLAMMSWRCPLGFSL